jgi:hypothetical protein
MGLTFAVVGEVGGGAEDGAETRAETEAETGKLSFGTEEMEQHRSGTTAVVNGIASETGATGTPSRVGDGLRRVEVDRPRSEIIGMSVTLL